jgi:hypothetical protein
MAFGLSSIVYPGELIPSFLKISCVAFFEFPSHSLCVDAEKKCSQSLAGACFSLFCSSAPSSQKKTSFSLPVLLAVQLLNLDNFSSFSSTLARHSSIQYRTGPTLPSLFPLQPTIAPPTVGTSESPSTGEPVGTGRIRHYFQPRHASTPSLQLSRQNHPLIQDGTHKKDSRFFPIPFNFPTPHKQNFRPRQADLVFFDKRSRVVKSHC